MSNRSKTLTKKDVARRVSELVNEPIYKCEPWVASVIGALGELMMEADPEVRIELRDFGVFEVHERKSRVGRNPKRPQDTVVIPSRKVVKFKAGKKMKQRVRAS
ncbi:HU family DNA-binding protein [bacterium]|nr:HU family DNA-binding protein [bacterium]